MSEQTTVQEKKKRSSPKKNLLKKPLKKRVITREGKNRKDLGKNWRKKA
jgi:hypothetical protein